MHEGYLYLLNLWAYMALFEGADVKPVDPSRANWLALSSTKMRCVCFALFRKSTEHHRSEHW